MPLCNQMLPSYTLAQSAPNGAPSGDGRYDTQSALNSNIYTYYRSDGLHFTFLPTGAGQGQTSGMVNQHISLPIPGTGFNLSVWFNTDGNLTGNNIANLPAIETQQADELLAQWQTTFGCMAQEMMNMVL